MEKFFKLRQNGTTVSREIIAGATTFFAMAYIIFVNPMTLSPTGMPEKAVFLATIFAAIAGTLVMGLFANVPYAQAPGMGLNAFFTYTVCFGLKFTWQQALGMVFLCGVINVLITVTKVRKLIIKAIPASLQHAIGGGIGVFVAYIGIKNAGLLGFIVDPGNYHPSGPSAETITIAETGIVANSSAVPELVLFNNAAVVLALIGIVITFLLLVLKVKGAIFIGIVATTVIGIPMGVTQLPAMGEAGLFSGIGEAFSDLGVTFGAALGKDGLISLFTDVTKIPLVLMTIFAFSLSDTFDTIGTFIGTGRRSGIFDEEDEKALQESKGFKSKMDKALFADSIATSVGAIFGTSNTTTFVESAAGIEAGGRTGLTAVVTSVFFAASILLSSFISIVPTQATAPALIAVGVMMLGAFKEVDWNELEEAIPAFFATIFMGLNYSISNGIAFGFLFFCLIKLVKGKAKEISPILAGATILFLINYIILAFIK